MSRRSFILSLVGFLGLAAASLPAGDTAVRGPQALADAASAALPPLPPSPVEVFRKLLDQGPAAQARALAERPDAQREILAAKLREYRELPPEERQRRLEATELHWYLRPLMATPPTNRAAQINLVPEPYRAWILDRLRRWDGIEASARRDILQNESAIRYVLRWRDVPAAGSIRESSLSPARQQALERELARWRALSEAHRERMCRQFEQFFQLPGAKQEKALETFPEEERRSMETTLRAFARLPAAQRQTCIAAFRKFTGLSEPERVEFLRSADRWRTLTPAERESWRKLVLQLPPLPPGAGEPPLPPSVEPGQDPLPPLPKNSSGL